MVSRTDGKGHMSDAQYAALVAERRKRRNRSVSKSQPDKKPKPPAVMGRPKGSVNKPKEVALAETSEAPRKLKIPDGSVSPFPLERFRSFCRQLRIQSKDSGVVHFEFLGSQLYVLEEIVKGLARGVTTFIILKGRQQGMSTLFLAMDLFEAFEHPGTIGLFATHDEGSREQFRNQIEVFLQGLPKSHKIDYETNNRMMLVLKNLSMFRYLVAGTRATTNKLGRSGGCNFCHATEVAFWGSGEDLKALMQTFSETYPHRKYFFESTANGFNHFEEMYRTAEDSPAQMAIFSGWWRDERNEFGADHPLYLEYMPEGTKTTLSPLEKRKMKEVKEQYDFNITAGQLAWYRFHLETKCSGDQSMMNQEQPWTAEDAFISTGSSFFATDTLTTISKEARHYMCLPFVFKITNSFTDTAIRQCPIAQSELKIWEMPVPGAKYVIGADPIFGSSDNRDNGVISIFRCYADCCVQVAEYVSPSISAYQYAWVIAFLAGLYDDVLLTLEMTGPGSVVYEELKQLRQKLARITPGADSDMKNCLKHMRDFLYSRSDSLSGNMLLQWKSSPELRMQLLFKYRDGITTGRLRPRSMHLVDEMRYLTIDGGYVGCPSNKQDDRVFGAALAYWGWDMRVRKSLFRMGLTIAQSKEIEEKGDPSQLQGMVQRFLKGAKINVPQ